jgi:hypothetical protein
MCSTSNTLARFGQRGRWFPSRSSAVKVQARCRLRRRVRFTCSRPITIAGSSGSKPSARMAAGVVVHAVLDAKRGLTVPATVIHVNDWTS